MKKRIFLFLLFVLLVSGGAFAQKVGDTVQVFGDTYTVQSVSGDTVTLRKAQASGDLSFTAVSNSTFGTSQINAVAYGNNTWVAVGGNRQNDTAKIAYSN